MTSKPARLSGLKREVVALYERNRQQGFAAWRGLDYDFVCPSSTTYPFQWFWDSCFHAIVLSHLDTARASAEITCLLANSQPDGFIPHIALWARERHEERLRKYNIAYRTRHLSDCIQPPVLAEAVEAVFRRSGDEEWLDQVLPPVCRYYDWLDAVRDPDRDGLIAILQPDESGLDHSPKYDAYLGLMSERLADFDHAWAQIAAAYDAVERDPADMFAAPGAFVCEDVLVNTIYAENQLVLGGLLEITHDTERAKIFRTRASLTLRSLLEKCWDPNCGLFFDLAGREETPLQVSTVSSLLPLLLTGLPAPMVDALATHLEDPADYGAPYPVPSTSMREPQFAPAVVGERLLWRGPVWINSNWYLARGLRRHGRIAAAERIEEGSLRLIERAGFREYYNPLTGDGYGADDFSWSALVLDMLEGNQLKA